MSTGPLGLRAHTVPGPAAHHASHSQMESIFIHSVADDTVDEFLLRGDQNALVRPYLCTSTTVTA